MIIRFINPESREILVSHSDKSANPSMIVDKDIIFDSLAAINIAGELKAASNTHQETIIKLLMLRML